MTETEPSLLDQKVADALKRSWVYHLPQWTWPFAQLARWERPIGWQLLMWPCWWAVTLAIASALTAGVGPWFERLPSESGPGLLATIALTFLLPFWLGAFLMRGAGCTYNDLADIGIDNQVERTRSRPLPSGRVSKKNAFAFLALQSIGGLFVLLFLARHSLFVFLLGASSLVLVAIYPFMKRITWWPQLFLGLAFSWGALMGWAVVHETLGAAPLLLYLGSILWVIGYDTIYAHQDREDDALVGVKSTARLFGEKTKTAITVLYAGALLLIASAYYLALPNQFSTAWPAWGTLALGAAQMVWQIKSLDIHDGDACLRLFKSNNRFGLTLFAGLLLTVILVISVGQ